MRCAPRASNCPNHLGLRAPQNPELNMLDFYTPAKKEPALVTYYGECRPTWPDGSPIL